jgi:hypothetical protein
MLPNRFIGRQINLVSILGLYIHLSFRIIYECTAEAHWGAMDAHTPPLGARIYVRKSQEKKFLKKTGNKNFGNKVPNF